MMFKTGSLCWRIGWLLLVAVLACAAANPVMAQKLNTEEQEEQDEKAKEKTLDPRVAEDLLKAYELMEEEEHAAALEQLNEIMDERGEDMKPFDKASTLQIRGSAHINLDNQGPAIEDFAAAFELGALPENQQDRLRFNLAQLYFVNERYEDAIRFFEEWMADGEADVTDTAYFMLAASYYNLEQYEQAIEPIKNAIKVAEEPDKRYYDLLNVVYSQLDRTEERIALLETIVEIWPEELSYWRQLSGLYLEDGQRHKSFAALESAYVNGLVDEEDDIILLAQNYSSFDNPVRGAKMMEREMEAGNVERTVENLELLSQLWSQAREHSKAIPVLRKAAEKSEEGNLAFRLGQALLAEERSEEAERAFETALDKGGLKDDKTAEAWMLLGNARFNQADPGDREQREDADRAFAQAAKFRSTRSQASDWRTYIDAINTTERRQAMLEEEQQQQLAGAARQRKITGCRAQELAGSELSEECRKLLAEADKEEKNSRGQ